jgi:hypothetical protein
MSQKEATLTIEKAPKTPIDVDGKLEKRKKLLDILKKKLEDLDTELENKLYLVEGKQEIAEKLKNFIINEAEWKFSESIGIIQTEEDLSKCIKDLSSGKRKELMLSNLAIEAIYYFLTKVTGKGIETSKTYLELLKPISDSLSRAKADKEKKDQLVKDIGSVEHAIDMGAVSEDEEKMLAEIEADQAVE